MDLLNKAIFSLSSHQLLCIQEAEVVAQAPSGTQEWAATRLAALQAAENVQAEDPAFSLNFLWLDKNIGVAVDQVFAKGQRSPVTEFFFWPRKDAWEELKAALEGKPWIAEREKVLLLNKCTEVINYWQDETKHSKTEAQAKFADCSFSGTA